MSFRFLILTIFCFFVPQLGVAAPTYVGAETCKSCHAPEYEAWKGSHHDRAAGLAAPDTVQGRFDGTTIETPTGSYRFDKQRDRLTVTITDDNGKQTKLPVTHTFGLEPLQQYIVPLGKNRLQVLPVAWDSRPEAVGGQKWFYLYEDDDLLAQLPELDWDGYFHTWNGQCAECHATNLTRGYSFDQDQFDTAYEEINVSCEACHGASGGHSAEEFSGQRTPAKVASHDRLWSFADNASIAHLTDKSPHDDHLVDQCAACHARRSSLIDGHDPGDTFLNQYAPSLIEAPLYFADGQIHDEVYVYGSFLQSKMHQSGVICTDCHDPHSMKIKTEGNDLCAQCHVPDVYNKTSHHRHNEVSEGALCVNCHMPERTYMQVDDRRDHSFRVPRPLLSHEDGARDACRTCHDDKDTAWVRKAFDAWGITPRPDLFEASQVAFLAGEPDALRRLLAVYKDETQAIIKRATVLSQIVRTTSDENHLSLFEQAAGHPDPLIRFGLTRGLATRTQPFLLDAADRLLTDPVKAVRLEAARWISRIPIAQVPPFLVPALTKAKAELVSITKSIAFMPDARMMLGTLAMQSGNLEEAAQTFEKAVAIAPSDARGWINKAEALRLSGKEKDASMVLEKALNSVPEPASIHYALGLSLVRQKQLDQALHHIEQATKIDPNSEQYAYGYAVALLSSGQAEAALQAGLKALDRNPNSIQLLSLAFDLARRTGRQDIARTLRQRMPRQ